MRPLFLALALLGARAGAEPGGSRWKIILGQTVAPSAYPFFADIIADDGDRFYFCGAVQITRRHFLTAAHCLVQARSVVGGVRVDSRKVVSLQSRNGRETDGVEFRVHEKYKNGACPMDYDLAVLKTREEIGGTWARLPSQRSYARNLPPAERLIAIGHGMTETGYASFQMLETNLSITANCPYTHCHRGEDFCAAAHQTCRSVDIATGSVIKCQDTCQGDSGGPLFTTSKPPVLVGLTSRGAGCGDSTEIEGRHFPMPALYTDVGLHLKWIAEAVYPETIGETTSGSARRAQLCALGAAFFALYATARA